MGGQMQEIDISIISKSLKQVDKFYKKCNLIFEDIVAEIKDKSIDLNITNLVGPEGAYNIWNSSESAAKKLYVFSQESKGYKFVMLLLKVQDELVKGGAGAGYKTICQELGADIEVPLFLVYGKFEPRDDNRFINDLNLKRHWTDHILKLRLNNDILSKCTTTNYKYDEYVSFETDSNIDTWWCSKSKFKIIKLVSIQDSENVEKIVNDLIEM